MHKNLDVLGVKYSGIDWEQETGVLDFEEENQV
jgi:hypothetical protein